MNRREVPAVTFPAVSSIPDEGVPVRLMFVPAKGARTMPAVPFIVTFAAFGRFQTTESGTAFSNSVCVLSDVFPCFSSIAI